MSMIQLYIYIYCITLNLQLKCLYQIRNSKFSLFYNVTPVEKIYLESTSPPQTEQLSNKVEEKENNFYY